MCSITMIPKKDNLRYNTFAIYVYFALHDCNTAYETQLVLNIFFALDFNEIKMKTRSQSSYRAKCDIIEQQVTFFTPHIKFIVRTSNQVELFADKTHLKGSEPLKRFVLGGSPQRKIRKTFGVGGSILRKKRKGSGSQKKNQGFESSVRFGSVFFIKFQSVTGR